MKLEVGMYIRTDKGFIAKVKEFKHHYTKGKRSEDGYSVKEVAENYLSLDGNQCRLIESIDYSIPPCYPSDEELDEIKSHIVKTSYNIIDILEVGDIISFYEDIDNYKKQYVIGMPDLITLDEIKDKITNDNIRLVSILTKEQFEYMGYRIGE